VIIILTSCATHQLVQGAIKTENQTVSKREAYSKIT